MIENLKKWAIAAAVRALKSAAEAVLITLGADTINFLTVDWTQIAGIAAGMAFASLMFSIAGLPEVEGGASVRTLAKKDAER